MANRRAQKSTKNAKTDIDSEFDSQDFPHSQESEPSEAEHQRKYAFYPVVGYPSPTVLE